MYQPSPKACVTAEPTNTRVPLTTNMSAFCPLDAVPASFCFTIDRYLKAF